MTSALTLTLANSWPIQSQLLKWFYCHLSNIYSLPFKLYLLFKMALCTAKNLTSQPREQLWLVRGSP